MAHWKTRPGVTRSLRTGTDSHSKWYPVPVARWHRTLGSMHYQGTQLISDLSLSQNIAYSLQYLEYLQQTIEELCLSEVLMCQTIKSYVITSLGIVECLLLQVNKASGGTEYKLSSIISRITKKQLLGPDVRPYEDLDRFRTLRNKVHINDSRDELGTDYESFGKRELSEIKRVLSDLVRAQCFGLTDELCEPFGFLGR